MKVLHVIGKLGREFGGPSRSSQGLVVALRQMGVDAWLRSMDPSDRPWIPGVQYLEEEVSIETIRKFDLVHIHEIWYPSLHRVAVLCRKAGVPYVVAPRGMLEPWSLKQKWLKKRLARFLYQDNDLHLAAALHATAESEADQLRKLGFKNKIIVSPNGVNVPVGTFETKAKDKGEQRRVLFVSRMHPKKGVLELVEAWAKMRELERIVGVGGKENGQWVCELVYTMNSEEEWAYEKKVKARILELGMSYQDKDGTVHSPTPTSNSNFIFTGPLDDTAKWAAYARADLFVLPTHSENFGIVIAEALWAGVPVITTKGTPWKGLLGEGEGQGQGEGEGEGEGRCGWWIDVGVEPLVTALSEAMVLTDEARAEMGRNGRKLVEAKYTWAAAAKSLVEGYEKLVK